MPFGVPSHHLEEDDPRRVPPLWGAISPPNMPSGPHFLSSQCFRRANQIPARMVVSAPDTDGGPGLAVPVQITTGGDSVK